MSTEAKTSRLRAIRLEQELSQWDLALRSGVQEKTIRRLEMAEHGPRLSTARKLAEALGVTVEDLFPEPTEVGA